MVQTRRSQPDSTTQKTKSTVDSTKFERLIQSRWSENFEPALVDQIYNEELLPSSFNLTKVVRLEFSQYLENYLWKNYKTANHPSKPLIMSIVIMVNEKMRERIDAWKSFTELPDEFPEFFVHVLKLALDKETPFIEQNALITFICHCMNSLEIDVVRKEAVKITALPTWRCLGKKKLDNIFKKNPKLRKYFNKVEKNAASMSAEDAERFNFYSQVLWRLMQHFKSVLDSIDAVEEFFDVHALSYVEKFVLLLIDLEAQLTTRRFVHVLIESSQVIIHSTLSQFYLSEPGTLFFKLVQLLIFYSRFEVDNFTGYALNLSDISQRHYEFANQMQVCAFRHFREKAKEFSLLNVGNIDNRAFLNKELQKWTADELYKIAYDLDLVLERTENGGDAEKYLHNADYLREIIVFHSVRPQSQLDKINSQPLYPNEEVIWDENLVPYEEYNGDGVLPLNRLNLQFLTLHDYLIRNFYLFQMESTYEIRHDLEDVMFRVRPYKHETESSIVWGGWARMALPVTSTRIVAVGKPFVGQSSPSEVKADVQVNLPKRQDLRKEWEQLRRNDVLFLLTVEATAPVGTKFDIRKPFKDQFKVKVARGCEIEGMLNINNEVIDEMDAASSMKELSGDTRTYRVRLDPNQYQQDLNKQDVYFSFNLLVRRDPKANNFKAVLSTIRQLLNTKCVVPDWLHDVLLGYGEPDAAHYSAINNPIPTLDFNDTFIDFDHLRASFPKETKIICDVENPVPPFRLTFNELVAQHGSDTIDKSIRVERAPGNRVQRLLGIEPRKNAIRFTSSQIEAIKSGMEPGLTMVVGPPGTGKTDVAVQIIANIYHNWPEERTLIVTHSNQALNQLFEKIIALDVDERHLLRLGHGEEALETSKDFSRYGRVNYVLKERIELLKLVTKLKQVMNEQGDVDATCETAGYFYRYTMIRTWEDFLERIQQLKSSDLPSKSNASNHAKENSGDGDKDDVEMTDESDPNQFVAKNFPFKGFFDNADELFKGESFDADFEKAEAAWQYIQQIFLKLDEFRAFELLRNGRERSDYLLIREAKIIAMTCTHAALRRKELVEFGFSYDNCVMEEAAQILEVETFVPLLLQEPIDGINRLKRWIMIGDHHQLPPVVQNVAYQKYSNMEQSLFTRFIRLGVPHVQLDAQGRARSEIAALYNWRYKALGDLPHITTAFEYLHANPGFLFNYQFIDVPDFNNCGESTPSPYFYQNLGEAEYAVSLFTYMRILGYPAEKITILTTYNGQRSLIMDVLSKRCQNNPLIGMPAIVSTVDKYQGQQNDYVILSLVRTKLVGHLRDVRRLVVAMSRGRLGLYILGRKQLFNRCLELAPVFKLLNKRPNRLQLFPAETFETDRKVDDKPTDKPTEIVDASHMSEFVYQFYTANLDFLREKHEKLLAEQAAAIESAEPEIEPMKVTEEPAAETNEEGVPKTIIVKPAGYDQQPKRKGAEDAEGMILFEQIDFERLENPPNYGS